MVTGVWLWIESKLLHIVCGLLYSYIMLSGRPPFSGGCGADSCAWEEGGNCAECQVCIELLKYDGCQTAACLHSG